MFIVHVTPIVKGGVDQLSYFSSQEIPVGTIVYVPLRKKEVPALVLHREDARAIKSILRTNIYATRKIRTQEPIVVFSPQFIRAAQATAKYFAASIGSVIQSYVPAAILAGADDNALAQPSPEKKRQNSFERLILQIPRHDRIEKYKTIIRSNFAQGNSVFLCVPTIREARFFQDQYSRGIEKYTFLLESSQTKKKQIDTWNSILSEKHPVLIVATPTFASIPRQDISMFILEHEMSSSYKQQSRPKADARILVEYMARETDSSLVYAGTTVSLKVHKLLRDGYASELEEHTRKLRTSSSVHIVDSKKARQEAKEKKKEFPALSLTSLKTLKEQSSSKNLSFIFAARRGVATQTVCNDCNEVIVCTHCKSPMTLHERRTGRELLCHRCGSVRDANETCHHCNSWNLAPLGIGAERIESFLKSQLPEIPLFALTSDSVSTPAQARKVVEEFYATPGSVLIGTEMALSYLNETISCSIMSSIDSLLCIPDFHIEEKIFGIIAMLRERTLSTLIIETSSPKNRMLKYAVTGSLSEYAHDELKLRKELSYPPYYNLIKVTCSGTREGVIRNMQKFIERIQEKYKPRVFSGFMQKGQNLELHALLRVPAKDWPDTELAPILESLPMSFSIDVNPERTL